jgi:aspartyl-tRNA(Asn)/glutamyl-tRNA(Gln) amidotransferase subunit B
MSDNNWRTTIGLEVHVQLQTDTKMFCSCPNRYGADPNTLVCPVCMGAPGTLPVINEAAYRMAVRAALALNCDIAGHTQMARKNYYYPDLPKNYQISQYDQPFSSEGYLPIESDQVEGLRKVGIERVHMEEDAGKLMHATTQKDGPHSRVDLNRAGVPLLEIVTKPDIHTPDEAYQFLVELKRLLRYLEVSDCDMEKGSLRCDTNISVRKEDEDLGTKVEVKNLNSFKNARAALEYEQTRQINRLERGETVEQGTVQYDANQGRTQPLRMKEEESDYRYFPEPDLMPLEPSEEWINQIQDKLPERPFERRQRFQSELGLSADDAEVLTQKKSIANYFERALETYDGPEAIANWITKDVREYLNEHETSIDQFPVEPERLAKLAQLFEDDQITSTASRDIFQELLESDADPEQIMEQKDLGKVGDRTELDEIASDVIEENQQPVEDYLSGNDNAIQALMGQIMSRTQGKADPQTAMDVLREKLDARKDE